MQRRVRAVAAHDERTGARGHGDDLVIDRGRLHSVGARALCLGRAGLEGHPARRLQVKRHRERERSDPVLEELWIASLAYAPCNDDEKCCARLTPAARVNILSGCTQSSKLSRHLMAKLFAERNGTRTLATSIGASRCGK